MLIQILRVRIFLACSTIWCPCRYLNDRPRWINQNWNWWKTFWFEKAVWRGLIFKGVETRKETMYVHFFYTP